MILCHIFKKWSFEIIYSLFSIPEFIIEFKKKSSQCILQNYLWLIIISIKALQQNTMINKLITTVGSSKFSFYTLYFKKRSDL